MFDIEKKEILQGNIALKFQNQYELCSTFMRLQEYYESPIEGIHNTLFSLEQYMDLYAEKYGNFTYTKDWTGFNIPDKAVRKFFKVFDKKLLQKEKYLKKILEDNLNKRKKFYVIGYFGKTVNNWEKPHHRFNVFSHEIAHGLFYLNQSYKNKTLRLIKKIPFEPKLKIMYKLDEWGYNQKVFEDEIQAYLATSSPKELENSFDMSLRRISKPFSDLFLNYVNS